ncbi:hypothetical protein GQ53DRAFT_707131 [Thozetella sp. PMI_491]|nr:hypothetical protein GQ53DRAFT_707131 [Thozetella sp. PMI_491]
MATSQSIVQGGCFCKKIVYQFEGEPATKMICHCGDCKKIGSGVFALHYPIAPDKFSIIQGQPKVHKFKHFAGLPIQAAFCGDCGTWLYKQVEADPWNGFYLVQAGTTAYEPSQGAQGYWAGSPVVEIWVSQRAPWLQPVPGAEQRPEF